MTEYLLWVDLETTGLSYEQDIPLEVGLILTDMALNELARKNWICSVEGYDPVPTHPVVFGMHTRNGLLEEVMQYSAPWSSYYMLDLAIAEWVSKNTPPGEEGVDYHPAGSSVHFDLDFCRKRFPAFYNMLHHRVFDVSSIKMYRQIVMREPYDKGPEDPHRALGDLDNDIAWVKQYQMAVNKVIDSNWKAV